MKKNLNKLSILLVFWGIVNFGIAQIPNGYYNNAQGKTGNDLKIALHNIIKGHTVVSYGGLLDAYAYTDCDANGKIWDIYSNYRWNLNKSCGSYDEEGDCWNREHTWPQSWFNESTTPRSDLFHVMPTDGYVNGMRSAYPYGEVNKPSYTSGNGSKLGPCVTPGYSGKVFEPVDEYKGDIARNFFYMSVRYFGEDSGWSTSGMTNKSTILDWAMTMLLRWSDNDPVSQKEIDRNNAIYGYQNNRNPFIDHPEYARMIWDPNWSEGASYAITCASNLSHGSVTAPETAFEGTTVAITAIPDPGYMVDMYTVYKTGDSHTTVNVSSNGTFTMPDYAVTVSATFKQNTTLYSITTAEVTHGSISVSTNSALSGSTITMTATPESGYSLYSWYVYKTGDMNTTVYTGTTGSFVMPTFNVTVNASFSTQGGSANGDFVKVTEALTDWSGEYLIVYDDGNVAFDGGLSTLDAVGNTINVTINNNTIAATPTTIAAKFTIAKSGNNYTIKSSSGSFIGRTSDSNGLDSSTSTALTNSISYNSNDECVDIIGSAGAYLRFNNANNQSRFRYYKSGTYSQQKAIQLYKRTVNVETPTHTIHFLPNGGEGSSYEQTVEEYVPTALVANTFTRDGFEFDGWNTQANGEGTYYADNATITVMNDIDLYAQWDPKYTITLVQPDNGSISASPTSAIEESTITLTAIPDDGYELGSWIVTDGSGNAITVGENQFEMPADNVTVTASFIFIGAAFEHKYYLVTSAEQLVAGRTYLIVNTANSKALGATQNSNNRSAASVSISSDIISTIDNNVCELTLGGETGAWTFYDANQDGYLYAAGGTGNNNLLRTQATLTDEGRWTITIDENGTAVIKTIVSTVARNTIMYNKSSNIFSCYASGQLDVCLFIRSEEFDITENTTEANLFPFDKHTVRSGATLTVTGTANCTDANLLILDDGAEFVHHNDGVKATFKKNISAYSSQGGWFTIATPFSTFTPSSEMISDNYDLYAYDEDAPLEWINHKTEDFDLVSGQGYLYAHNPATALYAQGTLNNGDLTQTVNLSYANTHVDIQGFNLVGNPTAHEIQFNKSEAVSDGYYYISNGNDWTYEPTNTVPAGRGFLVKANAADQSIVLNPQSRSTDSYKNDIIKITVDDDAAYIKTDEGVSMPLISLNEHGKSLFLSHGNKPYVMLVRNDAPSIDLCYRPNSEGQHTLTIENETMGYLHLIDHLNGTEIDLVQNPSYIFKSTKNDYEHRFQLLFTPKENATEEEAFAYISNGQIIISLTEAPSSTSLQVMDTLGRIILTRNVEMSSCSLSTSGMAPGIYLLRLTSPEGTKVQKISID